MFTKLRARAAIASSTHFPLPLHANAFTPPIAKVRIRRAPLRPRAILASTFAAITLYAIFEYIVLGPLDKLELPKDEQTKKELEEPFFIPFPGTTKQIQPGPYRGSDPEWQEFVNFSKDQKLGKRVRDDLATTVRTICEKQPALTTRFGKNMKTRRYWLEVSYPLLPPPEFERSGIEIGPDFVSWTTMPVDSMTVFRIRKALWPSALGQSTWSFTKTLLSHDTKFTDMMAARLGMQNKAPQPTTPIQEALSRHVKRPAAEPGKSDQLSQDTSSSQTSSVQPLGNSNHSNQKHPVAQATPSSSGPVDEAQEKAMKKAETELRETFEAVKGSKSPLHMPLLNAVMAFQQKMAQTWRPVRNFPPRGSILLSGLVELDAPKAWITIDVKAAWDPKTKAFDQHSMEIKLRRLQPKRQHPPGGR